MPAKGNAESSERPGEAVETEVEERPGEVDFLGQSFVIAAPGWLDAIGADPFGEPVGSLDLNGCRHVIYRIVAQQDSGGRTERLTDLLTRRELEIAMLIAEGRCDKEIGRSLGISSYTVREHVRRACGKLGVSRRAAIVSVVIRSLSGMSSAAPHGAPPRSPNFNPFSRDVSKR